VSAPILRLSQVTSVFKSPPSTCLRLERCRRTRFQSVPLLLTSAGRLQTRQSIASLATSSTTPAKRPRARTTRSARSLSVGTHRCVPLNGYVLSLNVSPISFRMRFYLESLSCHVVRNYFVHRYRMYQPASWRNVIFCSLKFWIVLQTCNDRNNRNFLSAFIPIGVYTDSVAWSCVIFLLTIVCLCFSKFRVRL
jgi:hypothetical protein